jgi:hypothetical protein
LGNQFTAKVVGHGFFPIVGTVNNFFVILINVEDGLAAFGLLDTVAITAPVSSPGQAQTKLATSLEA